MMKKSGFVIAAVSSGSGKTTVTNGLLRAFVRRGTKVAPFKTGPDFIDTQFHRIAAGRDSINLDVFMSGESHVKSLFSEYSADCEVSVVEGVMGLFDGYDRLNVSAANIAALTGLP
ncbi:MAG: cobyrinate a,c-diamide synthase, partial [Muribaculaceae bacterium]|nr:cobyrinate a,c-diamide synthase [Muribaculaceae bacterium]